MVFAVVTDIIVVAIIIFLVIILETLRSHNGEVHENIVEK